MNKHSFLKCEYSILTCSIKLILINCIICILPCKLALKFHRYNRNTINKQNYIDTILVLNRIVQLASTVKYIRFILLLRSLIKRCFRLPEHSAKLDSAISKSMTKDIKKARLLNLSRKTINDLLLRRITVNLLELFPKLRLTCLDELNKSFFVQAGYPIESIGISFSISTFSN